MLDEADEMLDRGFAPDVERILAHAPRRRQTALFSATLPDWVATVAARHVHEPGHVEVDAGRRRSRRRSSTSSTTLRPEAKLDALRTLLDGAATGAGHRLRAYQARRQEARAATRGARVSDRRLQGNLSQNARERVMADFRSGAVPILLATNVAARGLDVPGVGQVINYELPESAELVHASRRPHRPHGPRW